MMYRITIYSPSDGKENQYECASTADLDKAITAITAYEEIGFWFRVERIG
jgi:hypothetical protein